MSASIHPKKWHQALAAYNDFSSYIIRSVDRASIPDPLLPRVAVLQWLLSVEDMSAIGLLMEKRCVGSVRSLIRPQFEGLVRGAWTLCCSDENNLTRILRYEADFPTLGNAVKALTALPTGRFEVLGGEVPFHELDKRGRKAMNDLTHRGARAVTRRSLAGNGGPTSIDDDELALFHLGASIGGIAAAALLERTGSASVAKEVLHRMEETVVVWGGVDIAPLTGDEGAVS